MKNFLEKLLNKVINYFGLPINGNLKDLFLDLGLEGEKFEQFEAPELNQNMNSPIKTEVKLRNVDILNKFLNIPNPRREMTIILTHRCNLSCAYCLRNARSDYQTEIPYSRLEEIIFTAHRSGIRNAGITGGEAFLYSGWRDLVKLLGKLKWRILWETNGLCVNNEVLRFMKKNLEDRIHFLVSLDSHKKEIHDKLRGNGAFQNAIKAIEMIKSYKFPLRINTMITPFSIMNEQNLINFVNFNKKLGVDNICFNRVVGFGRGRNQALFSLSENQTEELQLIIEKHKFFNGYIWKGFLRSFEGDNGCKRLGSEICISPFGIHPCIFQEGIKTAELKDFDNSLFDDFIRTLDILRSASMANYPHKYFSCAECSKVLPRYLKKVKDLKSINI